MRLNILAFAAGIVVLQMQPELPSAGLWAMSGGLLALPAIRWNGAWSCRLLGVLACLALGFAWAAWRADIRLADALGADWEGRDVELIGVVATLPQDFSQGSRFEFAVETVSTATAVVPGRIMLSWYQGNRDGEEFVRQPVRPGERWRMTVRLKRPHGNANPNGFDYEAWLLERNIRATGYVRQNPPQRLAEMVWQPEYVVERLRHGVRDSFAAMLPAGRYPWAGILVALVIGDQRAIHGDLWTTFNRTGTTHLMSISGLHVTMVAALFGLLAGRVWRRVPALALRLPAQRAALLAGCLAAFLYVLLAGFAVPAQRTLYMLLAAALAMGAERVIAPSRTLCLALLVVLLIDPWAVLAAGFWLSFAAVGALLYVDAAAVGATGGWRERIRGWGVVQWAATLASLPILLLVFQQFSLVSPLANALAIPVVSFVVTPLALLAAVIPWWPIAALAHAVLGWLMVFLEWCAAWPAWQAPAPPLWAAIIAGLGVAICLLPRGMPGRLLGAVLLLPAIFWPVARPAEGEAWVTVLDVGQGLAAIVRTREHTLIYDPGPLYSAESDAGQRVVVPYLRAAGRRRGLGDGPRRRAGAGGHRAYPRAHVDLRSRPALQRRIRRRATGGRALPALAGHRHGGHPDGDPSRQRSRRRDHFGQVGARRRRGRFVAWRSEVRALPQRAELVVERGAADRAASRGAGLRREAQEQQPVVRAAHRRRRPAHAADFRHRGARRGGVAAARSVGAEGGRAAGAA